MMSPVTRGIGRRPGLQKQKLIHDLVGAQVAAEPQGTGAAKHAAHGATDLGGKAGRVPFPSVVQDNGKGVAPEDGRPPLLEQLSRPGRMARA